MLETFNKHFEIVEANTPELVQEAFKLRHQVFRVENSYIPLNDSEIETDHFDERSIHFLIRRRRTSTFIAGCRLILAQSDLLQTEPTMIAAGCISGPIMQDDRRCLAEYSRVVVSKKYTQQITDPDEKEASQLLFLGVMACAIRGCSTMGITHVCAAVEPRIIRYLFTIGAQLVRLGPSIEYHGRREPFLMDVHQALISVKEKNVKCWELLTNNGQYQTLTPTEN